MTDDWWQKKQDAYCIIFAFIYVVLEIPDASNFSHQPFQASKDMASSCFHKSVIMSGLIINILDYREVSQNVNMASVTSPFLNDYWDWLLSDFLQDQHTNRSMSNNLFSSVSVSFNICSIIDAPVGYSNQHCWRILFCWIHCTWCTYYTRWLSRAWS